VQESGHRTNLRSPYSTLSPSAARSTIPSFSARGPANSCPSVTQEQSDKLARDLPERLARAGRRAQRVPPRLHCMLPLAPAVCVQQHKPWCSVASCRSRVSAALQAEGELIFESTENFQRGKQQPAAAAATCNARGHLSDGVLVDKNMTNALAAGRFVSSRCIGTTARFQMPQAARRTCGP
jgi:hypothetical protein